MSEYADTLLSAIGNSVLGAGVAHIMLTLAVLTSALAATQATFVTAPRLLLSMAAYKALPSALGRTNRFKSPTSTILVVVVGAGLFVGLTLLSQSVLFDSLSTTGMLICFYYGLTVLACVWRFRATLTASRRNLLLRGIIPAVAGLVLIGVFAKTVVTNFNPESSASSAFGIGGIFLFAVGYLVVGVVIFALVVLRRREFMSGSTLQSQPLPAPAAPDASSPSSRAKDPDA